MSCYMNSWCRDRETDSLDHQNGTQIELPWTGWGTRTLCVLQQRDRIALGHVKKKILMTKVYLLLLLCLLRKEKTTKYQEYHGNIINSDQSELQTLRIKLLIACCDTTDPLCVAIDIFAFFHFQMFSSRTNAAIPRNRCCFRHNLFKVLILITTLCSWAQRERLSLLGKLILKCSSTRSSIQGILSIN